MERKLVRSRPVNRPLRVQFVHGLESNPRGAKARFLASRFDALAPAMDTSDFEGCVRAQSDALETFSPDVVVGSSFGGAVAVALVQRGLWRGPTVLLCPAALLYGLSPEMPDELTVTVVHGTRDAVVPREHSLRLVEGRSPSRARLVTVDDDHRLQSLVDTGALADIVRETWERSRAPLPHGARASVRGALEEPYCFLSRAQVEWCEGTALGALSDHLPCWVPQGIVSVAAFGSAGESAVDAVTAHHGPWLWATEFANVHSTFHFDEPGFVVGGERFASVEHFFQRAKSVGTADEHFAAQAIASDPRPDAAFRVGRTHAARPDWEDVKREVMREGLRAKFTQCEPLRTLLLATGDHPLVQLKPGDPYWGTGPDGRGRNELGALLMELRAALLRG